MVSWREAVEIHWQWRCVFGLSWSWPLDRRLMHGGVWVLHTQSLRLRLTCLGEGEAAGALTGRFSPLILSVLSLKSRVFFTFKYTLNRYWLLWVHKWHTLIACGLKEEAYLYTKGKQELISRWDSERELLRSAPGRNPNSLKQRKITPLRRSRSFKVTDFGTNRKLIYDFLLVINSNLTSILHRFRDIAVDRSEIAIFYYPSCL